MLKYRIYILSAVYVIIVITVFMIFTSRGCYTHPNLDKSMPTIVSNSFYFIGKKYKKTSTLKRGDIILVIPLSESGTELPRRIIALPGETLEIRKGIVFINEKETDPCPGSVLKTENDSSLAAITIPQDFIYTLPDNRINVDFADKQNFVHTSQIQGKFLKSLTKDDSL